MPEQTPEECGRTVASLSAAKLVCELSGWTFSHLRVQRMLYIAHLVHVGRHNGNPLLDELFHAGIYVPVAPRVFHRARAFGRGSVKNIFHSVPDIEHPVLVETVEKLFGKKPSELVSITHWAQGAWAQHYVTGANRPIPNTDVLAEYRARMAAHRTQTQG